MGSIPEVLMCTEIHANYDQLPHRNFVFLTLREHVAVPCSKIYLLFLLVIMAYCFRIMQNETT